MSPKLLVLCCLCVLACFIQVADSKVAKKYPTTCTFHGKTYKKGDHFQFECNFCVCSSGLTVCSKKICGSPKKDGCDYKGKHYARGQHFRDGCLACQCTQKFTVVRCFPLHC